jgi:protein-S-isoprenylcysteine O-methyltransferase Ste14
MRRAGEYVPAALNVASALVVCAVSLFVDARLPMSREAARPVALLLVATGMALVVWAAAHIRGAFLGEVEPRLERLVREGPYRFVRHPVYVGMTVALAGVPVAFRNWLGLVAVLALFLPSEVYRARLEDAALRRRFGAAWERYAARTGFMWPRPAKVG